MPPSKTSPPGSRLDRVLADARREREARGHSYREQALKLYPWVCGRCGRHFEGKTLRMLTVHHRDHDHDNNPPDGSNWELLCTYCHENEHQRQLHASGAGAQAPTGEQQTPATYRPFADLEALLRKEKGGS